MIGKSREVAVLTIMLATAAPLGASKASAANSYPTAETVDYVLGCMATEGNNRIALLKCSCRIDRVAQHLPFSEYEMAETALNIQAGGVPGGRISLFRDPPEIKAAIARLHEAQAEASRQCTG